MIPVDLHTHSHFSGCGLHTVIEMLERARDLGIKGLAITDHGRSLGGRLNSTFFERLENPVAGIRLLKGMEANLTDKEGEIDVWKKFLPCMDIILLGLHFNIPKGLGSTRYTEMVLAAISANTYVDIITHPNDPDYFFDFEAVAYEAQLHGIVLELNNSKSRLQRSTPEVTKALVRACKRVGCRMAVNSDAHGVNELGLNNSVLPFLKEEAFPEELIVNNTASKAFAFIEERKERKMVAL